MAPPERFIDGIGNIAVQAAAWTAILPMPSINLSGGAIFFYFQILNLLEVEQTTRKPARNKFLRRLAGVKAFNSYETTGKKLFLSTTFLLYVPN